MDRMNQEERTRWMHGTEASRKLMLDKLDSGGFMCDHCESAASGVNQIALGHLIVACRTCFAARRKPAT